MNTDPRVEALLRELAPRVLGTLVRRYGQFEACEDAVQEALLDAAQRWSADGIPEQPRGWLSTVAQRRLTDLWRAEYARRHREEVAAALSVAGNAEPEPPLVAEQDDTLRLLVLCCHPELSAPSQIALTLRAVGGLSTAQIAAAFLVPEDTMARRITRAKQRITDTGREFRLPDPADRPTRLAAVLHVLYLIFNEGYAASSGRELRRGELTGEAIRLAREVHRLLPQDGEVAGLLALMLLTEARTAARVGSDGALIPLAEQDRGQWDEVRIAEGRTLVAGALTGGMPGPYQVQAAIAAVHAEAADVRATDWPQILGLYRVLEVLDPSPMVALNHAVALAMVAGPAAGLARLDELERDGRLAGHHRLDAVRAHLLELAGDPAAARAAYELAARRTTSLPEQRYLRARAADLGSAGK